MNGYTEEPKELDDNFGPSNPLQAVKSFDAFPKVKTNYTEKTGNGATWTVALVMVSILLAFSEVKRWWVGDTTHTFSVEQGIGHDLQINMDLVMAMRCEDLHINVQDASGDRILAGQALNKDPTTWAQWGSNRKTHALGSSKEERLDLSGYPGFGEYKEDDVHDHIGAARGSKKFKRTPLVPRRSEPNACRVYGSMHTNKVQGDFHITARGHGYMEFGQHLDHSAFNFSHHINEVSFGPFYPSLTNPLDNTMATTDNHFQKFQYYLSVVPTIYTTDLHALRKLDKYSESPSSGSDGLDAYPHRYSKKSVFTNQYAVTEQSHAVPENSVPGVFVKFDIEPILLTIAEEWSSFPALFVRIVNVLAGVLVAGGWCFQLTEWSREVASKRRGRVPTNTYEGILSRTTPTVGNGDLKGKSGYGF